MTRARRTKTTPSSWSASPNATATRPRWMTSRSLSPAARRSAWSARTAPARPPPSASSWARSPRRRARVRVLGIDIAKDAPAVRRRVGYVPERHDAYPWMTVATGHRLRPAVLPDVGRRLVRRDARPVPARHAEEGQAALQGHAASSSASCSRCRTGRSCSCSTSRRRGWTRSSTRTSSTASSAASATGGRRCCSPATTSPTCDASRTRSASSAAVASRCGATSTTCSRRPSASARS